MHQSVSYRLQKGGWGIPVCCLMKNKRKIYIIVCIVLIVVLLVGIFLSVRQHKRAKEEAEMMKNQPSVEAVTKEYEEAMPILEGRWFYSPLNLYITLKANGADFGTGYITDKDGKIRKDTEFDWYYTDNNSYVLNLNGEDTPEKYIFWKYKETTDSLTNETDGSKMTRIIGE